MFKINPAPTVLVIVAFGLAALPIASAGDLSAQAATSPAASGSDPATLVMVCKFMPRDERKALLSRFADVGKDGLTNGMVFAEIVQTWNVVEDDGTPVPLSVASIDRLLGNFEELGEQVLAQWIKACTEVRAKN